jgi:hypothetical protein
MNKKQRIELRRIYKVYQEDNRKFTYQYYTELKELDMKVSFSRIYHRDKTQYVITIKMPHRQVLCPDLSKITIPHKHSFRYNSYKQAKDKYTEILNLAGIKTNKQKVESIKASKRNYRSHLDLITSHRLSIAMYERN